MIHHQKVVSINICVFLISTVFAVALCLTLGLDKVSISIAVKFSFKGVQIIAVKA